MSTITPIQSTEVVITKRYPLEVLENLPRKVMLKCVKSVFDENDGTPHFVKGALYIANYNAPYTYETGDIHYIADTEDRGRPINHYVSLQFMLCHFIVMPVFAGATV